MEPVSAELLTIFLLEKQKSLALPFFSHTVAIQTSNVHKNNKHRS